MTSAQNTGGAGTDTLSGIEGVIGSTDDDTFVFSNPEDGAVYTVDGNAGINTIDLSGFASSAVTFGDGTHDCRHGRRAVVHDRVHEDRLHRRSAT